MKPKESGAVPILALLAIAILAVLLANLVSGNQNTQTQNLAQNVLVNPLPTRESTPSAVLAGQSLKKYFVVESALLDVTDNISLYFKDLNSDQEVTMDPTRSWIPASTVKAFVAIEAFRQRDLGLVNFNQPVTITADNVVPTELETDEFPRLREGTTATVRQLVEAMIIQSDNTAYNTLLDVLDRRNINATLKSLGFTETVVGEKLNLDDAQFAQDLQVPGRQANTTTVKDFATLFDYLYSKKTNDSSEIINILKRQKINNMIPVLLPPDTIIAHKTGDWVPIYHDGGIVFKPEDPFVLAVFTNSGDPSVVSKLAKVAYYQNADAVGKDIGLNDQTPASLEPRPIISLAVPMDSNKVLGETTSQQLTITAADLGMKPQDFNLGKNLISNFKGAWILPGSPLYGLKQFLENITLEGASGNAAKTRAYITLSKSRLAEAKSLLDQGNVAEANSLLDSSEGDLEKATSLAENDPEKDQLFLDIKQVSDLHYNVLSQASSQVAQDKKAEFIDTVYNFYVRNHAAVTTAVNSSVVSNPVQQKPVIGTIVSSSNNSATLRFDDGSTKQMVLPDSLKVRSFQQDTYQNKDALNVGDKIAVVGVTNNISEIVPEFVLKDVPKELPSKQTGTVIEINPNENTIKILDQTGKQVLIKIDSDTSIKSTDTNVSVEGIKAGSQITIFGNSEDNTLNLASDKAKSDLDKIPVIGGIISHFQGQTNEASSSSQGISPTPSSSTGIKLDKENGNADNQTSTKSASISNPTKSSKNGVQPTASSTPNSVIKATTIIVTGNGSGSHEKVSAPAQPSKESHSENSGKTENKPASKTKD